MKPVSPSPPRSALCSELSEISFDWFLKLRIKGNFLKCDIRTCLLVNLKLELNEKTQIFPVRCGVDDLGFPAYMTESGINIRTKLLKEFVLTREGMDIRNSIQ